MLGLEQKAAAYGLVCIPSVEGDQTLQTALCCRSQDEVGDWKQRSDRQEERDRSDAGLKQVDQPGASLEEVVVVLLLVLVLDGTR